MHTLAAGTSTTGTSTTGWVVGYTIGIVIVLVVVALVVPILLLARSIGNEAPKINEALTQAVRNTAPLGAPGVVAGLSAPTTAVEQAGAQGHRRECHQRRSRPETRLTPPPSPHRKARQPAGERRHRTHGRPEHEHVAVPQMTTCAVLRTLLTAVPDAEPSKPSDARADA